MTNFALKKKKKNLRHKYLPLTDREGKKVNLFIIKWAKWHGLCATPHAEGKNDTAHGNTSGS